MPKTPKTPAAYPDFPDSFLFLICKDLIKNARIKNTPFSELRQQIARVFDLPGEVLAFLAHQSESRLYLVARDSETGAKVYLRYDYIQTEVSTDKGSEVRNWWYCYSLGTDAVWRERYKHKAVSYARPSAADYDVIFGKDSLAAAAYKRMLERGELWP